MPSPTHRLASLLWGLSLAVALVLFGWHLYRSDLRAIAERAEIRDRLVAEQELTRKRLIEEQTLTRQRLVAEQATTRREVAKLFNQLHECLHPGHPRAGPTEGP